MTLAIIIFCLILEHLTRYVLSDIIVLSFNPGISFGFLADYPGLSLILAIIACSIISYMCIFDNVGKLFRAGLSFIMGGALSNLYERIFLGHVIDWIEFPSWLKLRYNIADLEISFGVFLLFIFIIMQKK